MSPWGSNNWLAEEGLAVDAFAELFPAWFWSFVKQAVHIADLGAFGSDGGDAAEEEGIFDMLDQGGAEFGRTAHLYIPVGRISRDVFEMNVSSQQGGR